ncbi:DUF6542 domain-containing protein [Antrihabitans cavernicola]|uniref:DUF6542 domain-containing protein n=1 Tax=Antrihabitans cavernicola TaxID=2495913 RepID=A0A5A7SCP8_9NOCA|nr:DUF6542 domain-containing protein [Spelaeibacter cavernicola]KAA0023930.1 hypothetical protein FOY51_04940 [Spelaeibacter cavernicola]
MSASQRARAAVPVAQRSVVPTVRGVSAGVAVLIAVGFTLLGLVIDAARGTELTKVFGLFYFLGCLVAVLAVRHKAIFTTMVQPPLILFVAVPLAYQYFTKGGGTSIKDVLLNVAIPLVNRFPWMLVATLTALVIGGARLYLAHHKSGVSSARSRRPRVAPSRGTRGTARPGARSAAPTSRAARSSRAAAPVATATRAEDRFRTPVTPPPATGPRPVAQPQTRSRRTPPPRVTPPRVTRTEPAATDYRPQHTRSAPVLRSRSDVPAHPAPQVRYRRREQPPYDR